MVIAGRTTAVYRSLDTRREVPHAEAVGLVRTLVWVASLDLMWCRWGCQPSFLSRITPRTGAKGLVKIVEVGRTSYREVICKEPGRLYGLSTRRIGSVPE